MQTPTGPESLSLTASVHVLEYWYATIERVVDDKEETPINTD